MRALLILCALFGICGDQASAAVLIRCGASEGMGYFFYDKFLNPEGAGWHKDGISTGQIILLNDGDNWDIQFSDAIGATGYKQDGAKVIHLSTLSGKLTVGAFHPNYVEVYTFDLFARVVAWTSHKTGTLIPKVAAYVAQCG